MKLYFISYAFNDGLRSGFSNAYHEINGLMTAREISKFEMRMEEEKNLESCTVISFQQVEFS